MNQIPTKRKSNTAATALLALYACGFCLTTEATASECRIWNRTTSERFESEDRNERRKAMDDAYSAVVSEGKAVLPGEAISCFRLHANRWEENSDKAILALGLLDDKMSMPLIRSVWMECGQMAKNPLDDRLVLLPRIRKACVMALFKMEDAQATAEVGRLLTSNDPMEIAEGIGCVAYSGNAHFCHRLTELLADDRNAVNVAPSGAFYWLRICDLAANALADVLPASRPEGIQPGVRWEDWQLEELKMSVKEAVYNGGASHPIGVDQALDAAFKAVGKTVDVEKNSGTVCLEGDKYVVTFPAPPPSSMPKESRLRGPDYAARVVVDGDSGDVLEVKVAP